MIWIHFVDFTGNNDDYSVADWDEAKWEAAIIIGNGLGYCTDTVAQELTNLLRDDHWREAVTLYNEQNGMREFLVMREGKRVYEP